MPSHTDTTATPTRDNLLSESSVCHKLDDISPRTLTRWRKELGFPEPIKLTSQTNRWRESDVDRWIAQRAAAQQPREAYRPASRRRITTPSPEAVTA